MASNYCSSSKAKRAPIASCFEVTGRAQYYISRMDIRIWPFGSKRILTVLDKSNTAELLLKNVDKHHSLVAQFKVCPLTVSVPHRKQSVCVENIRKPQVEKH